MKKIFTTAIVLILTSTYLFAGIGFFGRQIAYNNGSNQYYSTDGGNFGSFVTTDNVNLIGGGSNTFKNGSDNVTGVTLNYRIYPQGSPSGTFIGINLPFKSDGPPVGDQYWESLSQSISLTGGRPVGTYTIEVFFQMNPSSTCSGGGCFDSNGGSNYKYNYTLTAPLPVQLSAFSVNPDRKVVNVTWSTAQEINNKQFEVERSKDLTDWISVGSVEGRGTTKTAQNYEYTDRSPDKGINYYRLKQTDTDGTFTYTRTKSAVIELNPDLALMPNPATEYLRIGGISEPCNVEIIDARGQVVIERSITSSTDLGLNKLAKGIYFVRITDSISTKVSKILVEK